MANRIQESPAAERSKTIRVFVGYVILYLSTIIFLISWIGPKLLDPVWFYFAIGIGFLYVYISIHSFYDNYLHPYLKDLEKATDSNSDAPKTPVTSRSPYFWPLEWIIPSIMVQFLIVVFFWMTASETPFKDSIYTHPYMYGQVYEKMNNYISPEIKAAGFTKKLEEVNYDKEREAIINAAKFLEAEFSVHLDFKKIPGLASYSKLKDRKYDKDYIDDVRKMVATIYQIPFFIALTFAFLGTLMYSLNDIVNRFFISDLYPKTYVSYIIRFLFAPAVCMVLAYFFMNDWPINGAPILFFLVGFFPQLALQYLEEKARQFLKLRKEEKTEIPLSQIQGMTDYNIYRLKELGIGDAQNLAYSDINYLQKNWYNDRQLGDFISQAMLLIHLREDFIKFQNSGIRNIISFRHVVKDKECNTEECEQFAKTVGIAKERLLNLYNLVTRSPMKERIEALELIINRFDVNERRKLTSG